MKEKFPQQLRMTLSNMKQRCYNINAKGYKYYGGKGIIICNEWLNDKKQFYYWAINNGYQDGLSIDRIDTDGNYEPDNCRWITMKEQQSNRSNNVFIEIDGEIKTASQWSRETGIDVGVITDRYKNGKVDIFKESQITVTINGEVKTLKQVSKENNIPYATILQRYHDGWEPERLITKLIFNETQYIEINNEVHTIAEWAKLTDLNKDIIYQRIKRGWKGNDILKPKTYGSKKGKAIEINGEIHTKSEWCKIIGINSNSFYKRINKGLKGEEFLKPPKTKK